jgi:hypothetical protein
VRPTHHHETYLKYYHHVRGTHPERSINKSEQRVKSSGRLASFRDAGASGLGSHAGAWEPDDGPHFNPTPDSVNPCTMLCMFILAELD